MDNFSSTKWTTHMVLLDNFQLLTHFFWWQKIKTVKHCKVANAFNKIWNIQFPMRRCHKLKIPNIKWNCSKYYAFICSPFRVETFYMHISVERQNNNLSSSHFDYSFMNSWAEEKKNHHTMHILIFSLSFIQFASRAMFSLNIFGTEYS